MTSTPSPSELMPAGPLRLPAHCTTVAAEELRVQLVLAADLHGAIEVDASEVESIGQATLQLLVAARMEMDGGGQRFAILDPSSAFADRVSRCRLAELLGLNIRKDTVQ